MNFTLRDVRYVPWIFELFLRNFERFFVIFFNYFGNSLIFFANPLFTMNILQIIPTYPYEVFQKN